MSGRRLPPLNALRAFEAAARLSSFTEASRELHVTQSAISRHIKTLEEFLSVPLFYRQYRKVELTREGRAFFPLIEDMFDQASRAVSTVSRAAGTLRLKAPPTFAMRWLLPRIEQFHRSHPNHRVHLTTSHEHWIDFDRADYDAIIIVGRGESPTLSYDHLFKEELTPVCAPQLVRSRTRRCKQLSDVANHTLLHPTKDSADWRLWLNAASLSGEHTDRSLYFDTMELALAAAEQCHGIAIGDLSLIGSTLSSKRLVAPFRDVSVFTGQSYSLVYPGRTHDSGVFEVFRRWLLSEVEQQQN